MKDREIIKKENLEWLKQTYFSDPARQLHLQKGDILLREEEENDRLYFVLEGALVGFLDYETDHPFEAFRSTIDHFVGVYSFFSETHKSYSTVLAEEPTILAFLDHSYKEHDNSGFAEHFLPVVVDEIYMRQLLTQKMTIRNQEAMRKLLQSEKMAMLGQLAAGLAHELNNAVGVIQRQAEWLANWTARFVGHYCDPGMELFFQKALQEGQILSSSEVRRRRKEIEEAFDLPSNLARQIAATSISNEEIARLEGDIRQKLLQYLPFFEAGLALHDMLAASGHASQVVRSVKELGVSNHQVQIRANLALTIRESTLLLKEMLKGIQLKFDLEETIVLQTNPGELIQVWVNLIKNACESLHASAQKNAAIQLNSRREGHRARITITDNGPGIPEELLPRIFQPNVTTKIEGLSFGLGLGLSIVQRIVENMGGNIEVESQPGKTTFSVSLPISE